VGVACFLVKEATDCFLGGEEAVAASWKRRRLRVRKVAKKSIVTCSRQSILAHNPPLKGRPFLHKGTNTQKWSKLTELMHLKSFSTKRGTR
jgi:hypothetical protein